MQNQQIFVPMFSLTTWNQLISSFQNYQFHNAFQAKKVQILNHELTSQFINSRLKLTIIFQFKSKSPSTNLQPFYKTAKLPFWVG